MSGVYSAVGLYTIGQTPRPDLTELLGPRFEGVEARVCGLLDGVAQSEIRSVPAAGSAGKGYPLETRLRDGERVVVDAGFLLPLLKGAISRWDESVAAHLVLCAGPFPGLVSGAPLILPFEVGAAEMTRRGFRSLEIAVPFGAQASPAARKWERAGFHCRAHDLGSRPKTHAAEDWLAERLAGSDADAFVFDYVGLPSGTSEAAAAALDLPVFDLGRMAMDALATALDID